MPIGLSPGLYSVTITATSVSDESVSDSVEIIVEILETAAVFVSDEETGQSYIPGDLPQTMSFEVRNDGNNPDSFTMSLETPNGMVAEFTNLINGDTPEIDIGSSYNVSVQFSFIDGTEGDPHPPSHRHQRGRQQHQRHRSSHLPRGFAKLAPYLCHSALGNH